MKNQWLRYVVVVAMLLPTYKALAADWFYTVRPGDTIWDLCLQYTKEPGCWYKLDKVNDVALPKRLPPGYVISIPVQWLKEVPRPVEVTYVDGDVVVQPLASDNVTSVMLGETLSIGTKVVTREGNINLLFGDGSSMQLESYSELVLDSLSTFDGVGVVDSRLRLNKGAVKTRVIKRNPASRFQITTPAAVASVRGTEYRVSSDDGKKPIMRGEVFEGLVDVTANKSLASVAKGFGITAKAGEPLEKPRPLLPPAVFTQGQPAQLLPATIGWNPLKGALSYQLELLNDNDNNELLQRVQLQESSYAINTLDVGCYRLRLRGIDQQLLQGLASEQQLCIAKAMALPVLDKKNIHYQERTLSTLRWPSVEGAVQYRVQRAKDPDFTMIIDDQLVDESTIAISGEQTIYIRVQALGAQGQATAFSQTFEWQPKSGFWLPVMIYCLSVIALVAL